MDDNFSQFLATHPPADVLEEVNQAKAQGWMVEIDIDEELTQVRVDITDEGDNTRQLMYTYGEMAV